MDIFAYLYVLFRHDFLLGLLLNRAVHAVELGNSIWRGYADFELFLRLKARLRLGIAFLYGQCRAWGAIKRARAASAKAGIDLGNIRPKFFTFRGFTRGLVSSLFDIGKCMADSSSEYLSLVSIHLEKLLGDCRDCSCIEPAGVLGDCLEERLMLIQKSFGISKQELVAGRRHLVFHDFQKMVVADCLLGSVGSHFAVGDGRLGVA